jgi:hypothetical protein
MCFARLFQRNKNNKVAPVLEITPTNTRAFPLSPIEPIWKVHIFPYFSLADGLRLALTCKEHYRFVEKTIGKKNLEYFIRQSLMHTFRTTKNFVSLCIEVELGRRSAKNVLSSKAKAAFVGGITSAIGGALTMLGYGTKKYVEFEAKKAADEKYSDTQYQKYTSSLLSRDFWISTTSQIAKICLDACRETFYTASNPQYDPNYPYPYRCNGASSQPIECKKTIVVGCNQSFDEYCNELGKPPFFGNTTLCYDYFNACASINENDWFLALIGCSVVLTVTVLGLSYACSKNIKAKLVSCFSSTEVNSEKLKGSFIFEWNDGGNTQLHEILNQLIRKNERITIAEAIKELEAKIKRYSKQLEGLTTNLYPRQLIDLTTDLSQLPLLFAPPSMVKPKPDSHSLSAVSIGISG